jgi:hypothetical protein
MTARTVLAIENYTGSGIERNDRAILICSAIQVSAIVKVSKVEFHNRESRDFVSKFWARSSILQAILVGAGAQFIPK